LSINDDESNRLSLLQQEEYFLRKDGIRYLVTMKDKPLFQRHDPEQVKEGLDLFHTYEFIVSHSEMA
jgi:hypothetical protein